MSAVCDWFYGVASLLCDQIRPSEVLICHFCGEDSGFVRFNRGRVRQVVHVRQREVRIDLIERHRHAIGHCPLSEDSESDRVRLAALLQALRDRRGRVTPDPHLHYATERHDSSHHDNVQLSPAPELADAIVATVRDADFVGLLATGPLYAGFANSFGQRNWHETSRFDLNWSLHDARGQAVKGRRSGAHWHTDRFAQDLEDGREQLALLGQPAQSVPRGEYRVYLSPAALAEILGLVAYDGFALKSHRTLQTPLLGMIRGDRHLHRSVSVTEHHAAGIAPVFTNAGFPLPPRVALIEAGHYRDTLADTRSAREYGVSVNAHDGTPHSLEMAAGDLLERQMATALDQGLWLSDLWYSNFSDRDACRVTGMTRFACFQVRGGIPQRPIEPMRFDDSLYRVLGENLIGLTRERRLLVDNSTYERRSFASMHLPGALVENFRLTL